MKNEKIIIKPKLLPDEAPSTIGDFYWAYADILRGYGINESVYDQRILAFMALKLVVDNNLVKFNFDYKNNFNLDENEYATYVGADEKETFINLIKNISVLTVNQKWLIQEKVYNPDAMYSNILDYINYRRTFSLVSYVEELSTDHLKMVLDIYIQKANFKNFPKEQYKDLYETTIARMKKIAGDLTGQHFTQKSIIHLMCASALKSVKASRKKALSIYDPTCGTGSMLMESAYYFSIHTNKEIKVYGQENHGQTWFLCKIFLEISGIHNTIAYGNTLTSPAFDKLNGPDSFDLIIANPPFGVDWKHDHDAIIENMKEQNSDFFVIRDEKNNIITPKKSDGQFLFMQHILKIMQTSAIQGKRAMALVITSGTLSSVGRDEGSESLIRQKIFKLKYLTALVEQPNGMFTNTDITSHIWFFDNKHDSTAVQCLRAQNDEKPLFSVHPQGKDKMKNAYSEQNIQDILTYLVKEEELISKKVDVEGLSGLSPSQVVGTKNKSDESSLVGLFSQINETIDKLYKGKK